MKKFISRLISRHLFSYLIIFSVYFYSINTFDNIPSFVVNVFLFFTFVFVLENNYQQYIEDKKKDKKQQTFREFIHNVDWPIVIGVSVLCIMIYVVLVIFVL
ncbi:hypothetical protein [Enterococcus wangshanyuanii]|uniref:DUF3899 domain-containing protein n=1 Tax=Enterococcus wangshanyuanii TaxID=2005703 RepID=A0ABQ1NEX7_9ENTE|nr:hypothetical protein [Enterococcus wangshanyuanii]GGC75101.1 hypothetical protein GCM10011573_00800 [Enterococcus wangshanyuanii]